MKDHQKSQVSVLWTVLGSGAFAVLGVYLIVTGTPSDRQVGWVALAFFAPMTLISLLWEVGRKRQGKGHTWTHVKVDGELRRVWLMTFSKLQFLTNYLLFLVAVYFQLGAYLSRASTPQRQLWGSIGFVFLLLSMAFVAARLQRIQGIAIVQSGVLWLKGKDEVHIPWAVISGAVLTRMAHELGHGFRMSAPALGLALESDAARQLEQAFQNTRTPLSPKALSRLNRTYKFRGYHFIVSGDELVMPLPDAVSVINYLVSNPGERVCLAPEMASLGSMDVVLEKSRYPETRARNH